MTETIVATTNAILYADVHFNVYSRTGSARGCFKYRVDEKDIAFTSLGELKKVLGYKANKINNKYQYAEYFVDVIHE